MNRLAVSAVWALSLAIAVPAAPALAQGDSAAPEDPGEKVNFVYVYGEDECSVSPDAKVIDVCVRMEENERFRIPPELRESDSPQNEAWASRVKSFETVGNFGTLSCSPSGYGGWSGCTNALIEAAYEEKRNAPGVKAAQLIAEERAKRLETIDADASAEQERVEQLEKAYEAKLEAERDAPLPGDEAPADDGGE